MRMPALTLRTKIIGLLLGVSLIVLGATIIIVLSFVKPRLENKLEKRGQSIVHAMAAQCITPILSRQYFQLDLIFREFVNEDEGVDYLFVLSTDGEIVAHSFGKEFPVELKKLKPKIDKEGYGVIDFTAGDREIIDISYPLLDGTLGRIHVGIPAGSIKKDVNDILLSFTAIAGLFFLAMLLLLVFLERWVIWPIDLLKTASLSVQEGDFDKRVEMVSADEIGSLAAEFNRMLDTIKESRTNLLQEKSLLTKSEERFRKIIELSPISMALVAMDGTIEYINSYAIATFGYLPEDIPTMGDWWLKAYPDPVYREEVISRWMSLVEKAIAEQKHIERREYVVTCKDGTLKTMLIFGVIVADKFFVVFEDITQRKAAEEKIKRLNANLESLVNERTTELLRSNRDLSSFCYAISHELRAPVARLKGLSQALQEEWAENPADAEYCARRIEVASNELQRVINSVLQLSRLSNATLVPKPLNLSALVREIINPLVNEASDRKFELVIAADIIASGDSSLVRLCLENLLGNAVKYTAREALTRIEFGRDAVNGALFVKDNGIGFDLVNADNMFEPFTRLHQEEEFSGNGIGLATVQRIIERHGGRIWAESAPGQGATFYFTLSSSQGESHDA
jgi:PAS domain S-box-containing protein